jgi:hypothetical protein
MLIIKKNGLEVETLTRDHTGNYSGIWDACEVFSKIKLNESYGIAVLEISQVGPFAITRILAYMNDGWRRLMSNILEWRAGALRESDAINLLIQHITEAKPTVFSDYRKNVQK